MKPPFFGSDRLAGRFVAPIAQPKWPYLSPKTLFFILKSIFGGQPKKDCYNDDGTPQRQPFFVDCIAGWSPGRGLSIYYLYTLYIFETTVS